MKTHHVCYEGTLACSGCNPCPHCLDVVNTQVLAQAMRRTTEAIAQARGPKGVVGVEELDTRNFWAVFYGFYGSAWRDLHAAMMRDPQVAERAYDLRDIPGFTSTGRYVPPVIAPPLPVPTPAAVIPLSALAAQAPMPFTSAPGEQATPAGADAGAPWGLPFTLRDVHAPSISAAEAGPSSDNERARVRAERSESEASVSSSPADVEAEPKLVGPADIRREITADDIVASATVLDGLDAAAAPSANGLATSGRVRPSA